jgi:hypothetical protein
MTIVNFRPDPTRAARPCRLSPPARQNEHERGAFSGRCCALVAGRARRQFDHRRKRSRMHDAVRSLVAPTQPAAAGPRERARARRVRQRRSALIAARGWRRGRWSRTIIADKRRFAGRQNARGRGALGGGVLLSAPVAVVGAFDGRGRAARARISDPTRRCNASFVPTSKNTAGRSARIAGIVGSLSWNALMESRSEPRN